MSTSTTAGNDVPLLRFCSLVLVCSCVEPAVESISVKSVREGLTNHDPPHRIAKEARVEGLEPPTAGFGGRCSTN